MSTNISCLRVLISFGHAISLLQSVGKKNDLSATNIFFRNESYR